MRKKEIVNPMNIRRVITTNLTAGKIIIKEYYGNFMPINLTSYMKYLERYKY